MLSWSAVDSVEAIRRCRCLRREAIVVEDIQVTHPVCEPEAVGLSDRQSGVLVLVGGEVHIRLGSASQVLWRQELLSHSSGPPNSVMLRLAHWPEPDTVYSFCLSAKKASPPY